MQSLWFRGESAPYSITQKTLVCTRLSISLAAMHSYHSMHSNNVESAVFIIRLILHCSCSSTAIALWNRPLHDPTILLPRGPQYSNTLGNYYLHFLTDHTGIDGSRGEISLGKSTKRDRWAFIHRLKRNLQHQIISITDK